MPPRNEDLRTWEFGYPDRHFARQGRTPKRCNGSRPTVAPWDIAPLSKASPARQSQDEVQVQQKPARPKGGESGDIFGSTPFQKANRCKAAPRLESLPLLPSRSLPEKSKRRIADSRHAFRRENMNRHTALRPDKRPRKEQSSGPQYKSPPRCSRDEPPWKRPQPRDTEAGLQIVARKSKTKQRTAREATGSTDDNRKGFHRPRGN